MSEVIVTEAFTVLTDGRVSGLYESPESAEQAGIDQGELVPFQLIEHPEDDEKPVPPLWACAWIVTEAA